MKEGNEIFDVIIIGGGACGLMASAELSERGFKVALIEAKERLGGRIYTYTKEFSSAAELGAEFIHGNLPITNKILSEEKILIEKVNGEMWSYYHNHFHREDLFDQGEVIKEMYQLLRNDIPVSAFITTYLHLEKYKDLRNDIMNYVQGYHAAELSKASSLALLKDFFSGEYEDSRIKGGYQKLVDILSNKAENAGCRFLLSQPVVEVIMEDENVLIITTTGKFRAKKLMVTVSLGCLQEETIRFTPALPHISESAKKLGFGGVIKIVCEFQKPFWKKARGQDLSGMSFIFSEEKIPTWWTQYPEQNPTLTGWFAGPAANEKGKESEKEILDQALHSLSSIFGLKVDYLRSNIKASRVANWVSDPFTRGGYAYEVVNGESQKKMLTTPVQGKIFFAGEALQEGAETGTVEAALKSGLEVVMKIIQTKGIF